MNFSEFAQKFSRVLLEGENTVVFTRTLFGAIVQEESHDLLEKMANDTFKSYYNGRANINALARKINSHTDRCSFKDYIEDAGEVAVKKLCDVFSDAVPDINEKNAGEKLAELFDRIITEAAAERKKSKKELTLKQPCDILDKEILFEGQEEKNMSGKQQKVAEVFDGLTADGKTFIYNGEVTMNNSGPGPQIKNNSAPINITVHMSGTNTPTA